MIGKKLFFYKSLQQCLRSIYHIVTRHNLANNTNLTKCIFRKYINGNIWNSQLHKRRVSPNFQTTTPPNSATLPPPFTFSSAPLEFRYVNLCHPFLLTTNVSFNVFTLTNSFCRFSTSPSTSPSVFSHFHSHLLRHSDTISISLFSLFSLSFSFL